MQPGGNFPEAFAAVLCLQNASLYRHEKSQVLVSTHGHQGKLTIAQQTRRLRGPMESAGKQDFLFAGDIGGDDLTLVNLGNFGSRVAYRKAKKKVTEEPKRGMTEEPKRGEEGRRESLPQPGSAIVVICAAANTISCRTAPERWDCSPPSPGAGVARRPPFSTISFE